MTTVNKIVISDIPKVIDCIIAEATPAAGYTEFMVLSERDDRTDAHLSVSAKYRDDDGIGFYALQFHDCINAFKPVEEPHFEYTDDLSPASLRKVLEKVISDTQRIWDEKYQKQRPDVSLKARNRKRWHGEVQEKKVLLPGLYFFNPYCSIYYTTHKEPGLDVYMECPEQYSIGGGYEQFKAKVNGEWLTLRNAYQYGIKFHEEGPQAALDMIKRTLRAEVRGLYRKVMFGYYFQSHSERSRRYAYISNHTADADDLAYKLSVYKDVKEHFRKNNWSYVYGTTGDFIPGVENKAKPLGEKIDPSRPLMLWMKPYSYLYQREWGC